MAVVTQKVKPAVIEALRNEPPANKTGLADVIGLGHSALSRKPARGRSKPRLPAKTIEAVKNFYIRSDVSTPMPNKKRNSKDEYLYVLQRSLLNTFDEFKVEHPSIKLGFISFYE